MLWSATSTPRFATPIVRSGTPSGRSGSATGGWRRGRLRCGGGRSASEPGGEVFHELIQPKRGRGGLGELVDQPGVVVRFAPGGMHRVADEFRQLTERQRNRQQRVKQIEVALSRVEHERLRQEIGVPPDVAREMCLSSTRPHREATGCAGPRLASPSAGKLRFSSGLRSIRNGSLSRMTLIAASTA